MKIEKKELLKSQVELAVEMTAEEFAPFIKRGAEKVSQEIKIEGFRPGKVPYDILKAKVGEITILEEGARLAINKNLDKILEEQVGYTLVGQPNVAITKLAPGNPLEFKVTVAIMPNIVIGDYHGLKLKEIKTEVKNEEVEQALKDIQEYRAKEILVDREARDTDKVIADIEIFLDRVPIEGGQGKNTAILIGKNYIIPGFDKQLLGAKKDETREFNLVYPDNHHLKNLAGKLVDFRVKIKEIYERQLPTLNDDLAKDFGLKNLAELKETIGKSILAHLVKENEQKTEKAMLEKILEKSKFSDLPEMLIEHEGKMMMAELEQAVVGQGGKFEDYLTSLNKTEEQLLLEILPDAVKRVKVSLMIREIAGKENIEVTGKEIAGHLEEMKKYYKDKPDMIAKINSEEYKEYVTNVMTSRKVIDKLREWNIEKS